MSLRVDTASLIPGALVVGNRGLGVLGSQVPGTGTHGPAYIYPSLDLPDDAGKEVRGLIVTPPASGLLVAGEDSSFLLLGASDGEYTLEYRLFVDGADLGLVAVTFNVGPVNLAASVVAQVTATGALGLLRELMASAAAQGLAAGALGVAKPLGGAAAGQGAATGALALTVALTSAVVVQGTAAAALQVVTGLSAAATAQATATGQIALSIALGGAALASAVADGSFAGQVDLAGAAAASAGVEGALALNVPLGGDAAAVASAGGTLVLTVLLGAGALARGQATGALQGDVLLSGEPAGGQALATGALYVLPYGSAIVDSARLQLRAYLEPELHLRAYLLEGQTVMVH